MDLRFPAPAEVDADIAAAQSLADKLQKQLDDFREIIQKTKNAQNAQGVTVELTAALESARRRASQEGM